MAARDCGDCQRFLYDEQTGQRLSRRGAPIARPPGTLAPCRYPTGCPKGTPEESQALSEKNRQAYEYYLQVQATGLVHDDALVKRNCGLCYQVERALSRSREPSGT